MWTAPPPSNSAFIGRNSNRNRHRESRVAVPAPALLPDWRSVAKSTATCDCGRIDERIRCHVDLGRGHLRQRRPPPPPRMRPLTAGIGDAEVTSVGSRAARTFEPVVDYPSVVALVSVVAAFTMHKLLVNTVSEATDRRIEASRSLAIARERLSSADGGGFADEEVRGGNDAAAAADNVLLAASKLRYEDALREEERLRTIIPGVRIEGLEDLKRSKNTSGGFSPGSAATVLLIMLVLGQIVSLVFLAVYPMAANNLFEEVTGITPN